MILFKTIRWKNFLSTGNVFTEINLQKSPNTLIVGENGAGKSTILDALCFSLYGKSFRKVKKDQLINSINGRDLIVEIEFSTYNKEYKIVRGIKPHVFQIYQDGQLLNQSAAIKDYQEILERNILRMNMKSFTQVVILGSSSFVPFMQLPAGIRREIIEDLLDIRVFSTMMILLKEKMNNNKTDQSKLEITTKSKNEILKVHNQNKKKLSEDINEELDTIINELTIKKNRATEIDASIKDGWAGCINLTRDLLEEDAIKDKISDAYSIEKKLRSRIKTSQNTIDFFLDHDHCPTCTQPITKDIKDQKVSEKTDTKIKATNDLEKLIKINQKLQKKVDHFDDVKRDIKQIKDTIDKAQVELVNIEYTIGSLEERKRNLETKSQNSDVERQIEEVMHELELLDDQKRKLLKEAEMHSMAQLLLKDGGIKSLILKQYIPIINTLANKYLAAMDFFVKFELNELFEEKILSRGRDDFTYDSFSEGEKMRIDLSLLFTWRTIAKMKNSANTNLLILDEVFDASLDTAGCEEFLNMIHTMENTNIFVISHKGDMLQDKFRSAIKFEKHNNFSRIATI